MTNWHSATRFVRSRAALAALPAACALAGCRQAPTFNILGSFFPAWLICLFAGVVLAVVTNRILVHFRMDNEILLPILIYPCVALLFACALWLICFS
ncbi:MAG TPA: YtcA family lipoprotein [Terracidiphilus sp.]|jgi:fructose-specific phosphotransferase system IIC component|nr:YtcA family lipoprotein [Terracidiphilus sp.]